MKVPHHIPGPQRPVEGHMAVLSGCRRRLGQMVAGRIYTVTTVKCGIVEIVDAPPAAKCRAARLRRLPVRCCVGGAV